MQLNRLLPLLIFFLVMTLPSKAQFKIGVRAGMTISTISNGVQKQFDRRVVIGQGGGLIFHVQVGDHVVVQSELLLNSRGTAYKIWTAGVVEEANLRIYYLDVPVIVKGYFGNGSFKGYAGTGPQFGVGLFSHNVYRVSGVGIEEKSGGVEAFPNLYKRFEMGWNVDLGFHLELNVKSAIEVGVRPMVGVSQLVKNEFSSQSTRNIMIVITAAYLFGK